MMWQKVGVEKDAAGLRSALADIERLPARSFAPHGAQTHGIRAANYEWLDAIDAVNMLDACELIIHSSLEREESRGPFMRRDFPQTDNAALAGRECHAQDRQRLALRAAALRAAVLQAGLRAQG